MGNRLLLACLLLVACSALAHDGGFGHSRRTLFVRATVEELHLEYRILQNRDEALVELAKIDANGDGKISVEEKDRYFQQRGRDIAASLKVRTKPGDPVPVQFARYELGQSLAQTYHLTLRTKATEIVLEDRAFPHKPGLVQLRPGAGVKLEPARQANLAHAERLTLRILRVDP